MGYKHSEEFKAKMKGNTHSLGYKHTEDQNDAKSIKMKGKTNALGSKRTEEQKAAMSGKNSPNWRNGISFEPYCEKFNEAFKKTVRDEFGNECFLCGKSEADNGRKLSVHHPDYNKQCGCDGTVCRCVPLCISCHSKTNCDRDYWQCLIMEMLKPFEA